MSQAAALALRQLQDQLGAAYLENTKLQEEAARDRAEALQIAQAQHKELEQSERANAALKEQLGEMQGLLQVLLASLRLTLVGAALLAPLAIPAMTACPSVSQHVKWAVSEWLIQSRHAAGDAGGTGEHGG